MTDKLRCRCGKEVGIVRLNGRVLALGHKQNSKRPHVIRLATPSDGRPPIPVGSVHRGAPPVVAGLGGVPPSNPGRVNPGNRPVRALRPSEGGRVESRGAPLLRDSAPFPLSAGRARVSSGDGT